MNRRNKGFTLVEILIVVIILGILAAIVIPQFTEASNDARTSALQSDLQTFRSQLQLYKVQHNDTPPTEINGGATCQMVSLIQNFHLIVRSTRVRRSYWSAITLAVDLPVNMPPGH